MDRKTAKKLKLVLGTGVIALLVMIGFSALDGFANPYKTVSDVVTSPGDYTGRQVQVEGDVIMDSISWEPPVLTFTMTDGVNRLSVRYEGILPGSFPVGDIGGESKIDVVSIGQMNPEGEFEAGSILVKCPSKYESKLNETSIE
jgi:cytochrome c-type biogenesis protein CcmE